MNETINIESCGVMPHRTRHNHEYYIRFYIEDCNTELEEMPERIIIWESSDNPTNPQVDMNKADRIAFVKENFSKSELLTDEMIDLIDEDNRLQSEILEMEYRK